MRAVVVPNGVGQEHLCAGARANARHKRRLSDIIHVNSFVAAPASAVASPPLPLPSISTSPASRTLSAVVTNDNDQRAISTTHEYYGPRCSQLITVSQVRIGLDALSLICLNFIINLTLIGQGHAFSLPVHLNHTHIIVSDAAAPVFEGIH